MSEPRDPEREPDEGDANDVCHGTGYVNGDPEQGPCSGCSWCMNETDEREEDEPWRYQD